MTKWALTLILYFSVYALHAQQYERDYQQLIHQQLGGEMEVMVGGGRIDILNDEYAIEVEFANKWKNSIGQALWYSLQTGKQPGIVLIKKNVIQENRYVIQLQSTLDQSGLGHVKLWVWPDDFSEGTPTNDNEEPAYWMTISSRYRHNTTCRYYQKSQGRSCTASEGIACGICGG